MRSILRCVGFITLVGCMAVTIGFTQPRWTLQHPLPTPMTLNDVVFLDAHTGFAVGEAGTIIKTTDTGTTWTERISNAPVIRMFMRGSGVSSLERVVFTDPLLGTIVGAGGAILRTIDGGDTWKAQVCDSSVSLYGVCFRDIQNGLAVGSDGAVFRTTTGGRTWQHRDSTTGTTLSGVVYFDDSTAVAVGSTGTAVRSTDGGSTWTDVWVGGKTVDLNDVCKVNDSVAIAAGNTILRSEDRGLTWRQTSVGPVYAYRVRFVGPDTGFICCSDGFLSSVDAGRSWSRKPLPSSWWAMGMAVTDARTILLTGSQGLIVRSTDGGTSWVRCGGEAGPDLHGVYCASTAACFAVGGEGRILRTSDAGSTWTVQRTDSQSTYLWDVASPDGQVVVAVGSRSLGGLVLRSSDAGSTWASTSFPGKGLRGVTFADPTTGIAVGDHGTILKTTDGGLSWLAQKSGSGATLMGAWFTDARHGTVVGDSGIILRTNNGGVLWARTPSGSTMTLRSVAFHDSLFGFVVGGRVVLRTTDGGLTWTDRTPSEMNGLPGSIYDVACPGQDRAILVCKTGIIHSSMSNIRGSTDGGLTWTTHYTLAVSDFELYGVSFSDDDNGMVVGDRGIILRTTNGGATWVEHEKTAAPPLPSSCKLLQNYPNPFNPNSDIRYLISEFRMVRLAVYDLLGREVAVLVNEKKDPGTYTVTWNASGMASGVYLCRMTAGTFTQTRRMVLIR